MSARAPRAESRHRHEQSRDWRSFVHRCPRPRPGRGGGPAGGNGHGRRQGDWNALHRDLYGDLVFPLQVVIGLDEPGV
ncbi:2OG-Fe(II) oxygenase, partial [Streptosporangium sp. NPDC003464]